MTKENYFKQEIMVFTQEWLKLIQQLEITYNFHTFKINWVNLHSEEKILYLIDAEIHFEKHLMDVKEIILGNTS